MITNLTLVAPRAGAWIETEPAQLLDPLADVAPRAGAWIETRLRTSKAAHPQSRPPRGGVD